jgi:hypothetical protein
MSNTDYRDSWAVIRRELAEICDEEKEKYPDLSRLNVSTVAIRYGLRPWDNCHDKTIYIRGDHADGIVEGGSYTNTKWDA